MKATKRQPALAMLCVFLASVCLMPSSAHAQIAPACEGDANGDGVVNFADITAVLGSWLKDYTPGTGLGDANGDGVVNFADVTSVLGNWLNRCQGEPFALGTESGHAGEVFLTDANGNDLRTPAEYRIDLNVQQLAQGIITLDAFSIVAQVPNLGAGGAAPLIMSFWTDPKFEASVANDTFTMPIRLMSTSALVDQIKPPLQEGEGTVDGGLGFTEVFEGVLQGRLMADPNNQGGRMIALTAEMSIDPARSITKRFPRFRIAVLMPLFHFDFPIIALCPLEDRCKRRQVLIRPVLYQRSNGTRTGGGRGPIQDAARKIWLKCCVDLVFLTPVVRVVPFGVDIDNVTDAQAVSILGVDSDASALEVIFVGGFNPPTMYGGARVNRVGRGADGRAIFSDACGDGSDPGCGINTNVMSHEVGHLFGLCHPGCAACPGETPIKGGATGYNQGTAGTCMAPSGAAADNPPENSRNNCGNACNALMTLSKFDCCKTTEL